MNDDQLSYLHYTIGHFQEVARQNRFPENGHIDHDTDRCVVCHPELLPWHPFATYLEVVTQSVKVRRPVLDQDLADEINKDLELVGSSMRVSLEAMRGGDAEAVHSWKDWLRDAVSTGLDLFSIHSASCSELSLEDGGQAGMAALIERKILGLMDYQKTSKPGATTPG